MKKVTLMTMLIFALMACNNTNNKSSENTEEPTETEQTVVGDDRDDRGCLVSAGETWSELMQSCVQVFEIGQRLNPIDVSDSEAEISAFVLFNDDKSQVEVFLPSEKETTILEKGEEDVYGNDSLKYDAKDSTLHVDGEAKYRG